MPRDAQGYELTGATGESARHFDTAVRAFALAYGDVVGTLGSAEQCAPRCAMVHLAKAWVQALSNDPPIVDAAKATLAEIADWPMNERERAHHAALGLAAASQWAPAVTRLDRHLADYPLDLLAHQCVMRLDGFLGRFHQEADRAARALPHWSKDMPGYGIMRSFYGFGLEETGDYARAEDVSREAALLEPNGYWPHHAVSHVLEMTGRPKEGLAWMDGRAPLWAGKDNANRVHIWWHKSLFHVELGQYAEALALYDDEILPTLRPVGTSLCNPTALLWRLETMGTDAGNRWGHIADLWKGRADGRASPFNDIHYAMTSLRADRGAEVEHLVASMRRSAAAGGEHGETYRDVGLPIVAAMQRFVAKDYAATVAMLLAARPNLSRMGGSTAQRDLIDWTLTVAAIRSGHRDVALSLAGERMALRPASAVNQAFLKDAEALAA